MRWLAAVVLAGCSFEPGPFRGDAGVVGDDARDAPTEDAPDVAVPPANCYARWLDGTIRFDTAVEVPNINSTVYDRDPFLLADELTLYVASGRAGATGGGSVFVSKRLSMTAPFSNPTVDPELDSTDVESKVSFTSDGLYAVIGTTRGGGSDIDVWESTRTNTSDPWPAFVEVGNVNTNASDHDPTISADGLRLYIAPQDQAQQRIVVATRASRSSSFGSASDVINSGQGDADPSPTPDERILVFSSNRAASGGGGGDVWYTARAASTDPWGTQQAVPDINTSAPEGDPHLSTDGCRIYFARNLGSDNYNIFVATALP